MNFTDVISYYQIPFYQTEGFALWKIVPAHCQPDAPACSLHAILYITKGELIIKCEENTLRVTANSLVNFLNAEQPFSLVSASENLQGYMLLFSKSYITNLLYNLYSFPASHVIDKKDQQIYRIDYQHAPALLHCLRDLEQTFNRQNHIYLSDLLKCKLWGFMLEMAYIFQRQNELTKDLQKESNQPKRIFMRFMTLLSQQIRTQHTAAYYAAALDITPQYLGRVVRDISGKTVYQWVCEMLTEEIARLLDHSNLSIQQISEELQFSDQAVMTKIFKRVKGISPLKYRNKKHETRQKAEKAVGR